MEYHFQKYDRPTTGGKKSDPSTISIINNGFLWLSRAFYQQNNIHQFSYAHLYYDPFAKALAIVFTAERTKDSLKITTQSTKGIAIISATGCMKNFQLDPTVYKGRYKSEKQTITGIGEAFIIHLDKPAKRTKRTHANA